MVAEKYFAFVLILCGLSAINTDVVLPRKHFIDWATFDSQVRVSLSVCLSVCGIQTKI